MADLYIQCPHCDDYLMLNENHLNCRIFRHGVFKSTLKPINPHATREICEQLKKTDQIFGCGKPFLLRPPSNMAEKCSYEFNDEVLPLNAKPEIKDDLESMLLPALKEYIRVHNLTIKVGLNKYRKIQHVRDDIRKAIL